MTRLTVKRIFIIGVGVILVFVALQLRLPGLTDSINEDELHHNFWLIVEQSAQGRFIGAQLQPLLEYLVRLYFWFPFFGSSLVTRILIVAGMLVTFVVLARRGARMPLWQVLGLCAGVALALMAFKAAGVGAFYSEAILKMPSLVYALLGVLACFVLPLLYMKQRQFSLRASSVVGVVCALWLASHSQHISLSSYARGYTFAALFSIVWFWMFVVQKEKVGEKLFWVTSFLYANAHFFALPLVLAAYAYEAMKHWVSGQRKQALSAILPGVGVALATLATNWLVIPIYLQSAGNYTDSKSLVEALSVGVDSWLGLFRFIGFPFSSVVSGFAIEWGALISVLQWVLPAALLVVIVWHFRNTERGKRFGFLSFIVVPLLLAVLGSSSTLHFQQRYYSAFMGFGFVLIFLMLELLVSAAAKWKLLAGREKLAPAFLGVLLIPFLLSAFFQIGNSVKTQGVQISLKHENNSLYYRAYAELKQRNQPALLLLNTPVLVQHDIPRFYLELVGGEPRVEFSTESAYDSPELLEEMTTEFMASHPDGLIVLDWLLDNSCSQDHILQGDWGAEVTRVSVEYGCLWMIENLGSYAELCTIAEAMSFPALKESEMCSSDNS